MKMRARRCRWAPATYLRLILTSLIEAKLPDPQLVFGQGTFGNVQIFVLIHCRIFKFDGDDFLLSIVL